MINIYTLENCPLCEKLKAWLTAAGYDFNERRMDSAEALTDLSMEGVFDRRAPLMEIDGRYYDSDKCQDETFLAMLFGDAMPVDTDTKDKFVDLQADIDEQAAAATEAREARVEAVNVKGLEVEMEVISGRFAPDIYEIMAKNAAASETELPKSCQLDTTLERGTMILDVLIGGNRFELTGRFK